MTNGGFRVLQMRLLLKHTISWFTYFPTTSSRCEKVWERIPLLTRSALTMVRAYYGILYDVGNEAI